MSEHSAWILDFGNAQCAVGGRELIHLVYAPKICEVPGTPRHCRHVLCWENRIVPLMDLALWLQLEGCAEKKNLVAIMGHQRAAGEYPQFGALLLATPPVRAKVKDSQSCALPDSKPEWGDIAVACFSHGEISLPVLNLQHVFSEALAGERMN